MLLFAGSYERFLFGYEFSDPKTITGEAQQLSRKYTFAAHKNAVKCLAAGGPYVVSGGADDLIHLYDVQREKDLGFLMNPGDGAITCIDLFTPQGFATPSHMFSGSFDGSLSVWTAGASWDHLKAMKGHTAAVSSVTVHPSGRVAVSVSADRTLRMWNLVKGKSHYCTKLDGPSDVVLFSPSGEAYALVSGDKVSVMATAGEGDLRASCAHARRVLCVAQSHDDVLLTGSEDGAVRFWDLRTSGVAAAIERAHPSRVRGLAVVSPGTGRVPLFFGSASSDGVVKLWDSRMLGQASVNGSSSSSSSSAKCVAEATSNARLTCLVASCSKSSSSTSGGGGAQGAAAAAATSSAAAPKPKGAPGTKTAAGTAKGASKRPAALAATGGGDNSDDESDEPGPSKPAAAQEKAAGRRQQQQQQQQQHQQRPQPQGQPSKKPKLEQQRSGGGTGGLQKHVQKQLSHTAAGEGSDGAAGAAAKKKTAGGKPTGRAGGARSAAASNKAPRGKGALAVDKGPGKQLKLKFTKAG